MSNRREKSWKWLYMILLIPLFPNKCIWSTDTWNDDLTASARVIYSEYNLICRTCCHKSSKIKIQKKRIEKNLLIWWTSLSEFYNIFCKSANETIVFCSSGVRHRWWRHGKRELCSLSTNHNCDLCASSGDLCASSLSFPLFGIICFSNFSYILFG